MVEQCYRCSVGVWPGGDLLDTTDSLSRFLGGNSDVSGFSPGGSPGVSDNVVLLSVLSSVSNGGDGVVESGSRALGLGDNTTGVVHESGLLGIDGDGNWSLLDGGFQGRGRVGRDFMNTGDVNLSGVLGGVASSVSGSVGVVLLEVLGVRLDVVHGVFLPSTVATSASGVAVNELLLSKRHEVSSGNLVVSLHGANSGEGPAGSTVTLVLDWVHNGWRNLGPVNMGRLWNSINNGNNSVVVIVDVSEEVLELFIRHVRGEVVSISGGSILRVKSLDFRRGLFEVSKSHFIFFIGRVALSVFKHVVAELLLEKKHIRGHSDRGEGSKGKGFHLILVI